MDTREDVEDIWDPWDGWPEEIRTGPGFGRWGIDRLTLLLPLRGWVRPQRVPSADVHMVEATRRGLRIEVNPAQVTSEALHPCPSEKVIQVALDVVDRLMCAVPIGAYTREEVLNASLTRVDIARDFEGVRHVPELLDGISRMPRTRRLRFRKYTNRVSWGPNGITVGTNNQASLYDRHVLYQSRADGKLIDRRGDGPSVPEGVLRFEVRAETAWLREAGLTRLSDLVAEKTLPYLQDRWVWSRFGTPVYGQAGLIEAIQEMPWSDQAKRAHLWLESIRKPGQPLPAPPRERREHRERLAEIGTVTLKDLPARIRLDLASGTEVVD